jgi:hypothetical protein
LKFYGDKKQGNINWIKDFADNCGKACTLVIKARKKEGKGTKIQILKGRVGKRDDKEKKKNFGKEFLK